MSRKDEAACKKGYQGFRFINVERKLLNVIITLYQSTGILYGFDDGQSFRKKTITGDSNDSNKQDT